jgi:hypothetical protein
LDLLSCFPESATLGLGDRFALAATSSDFFGLDLALGFSVDGFALPEIPNMFAKKSQCPPFLGCSSAPASASSTSSTADCTSAFSKLALSGSSSKSKSSSSIGSTFFEAFPPK